MYIQSAFTNFIDFIVRSFNESCPMETIKIKYYNRHEWISRELKDQIKEREKLYINSIKYPTEAKWLMPLASQYLLLVLYNVQA